MRDVATVSATRKPLLSRGFPLIDAIIDRLKSVLGRHGSKLWWFHSFYALTLGSFVVMFAQKGFERARFLAVSVGAAWLLVLVFFSLYGSGAAQQNLDEATAKARIRFFVMTYVLKNLYQGMLFFLLPFYWKSATVGAPNFFFVIALGTCALLSTLDIVFDRYVMKRRGFAALFHGVTLFSCINLVIPALFPNTRTMYTLLGAALAATLAFWTLNVQWRTLKNHPTYILFLLVSATGFVSTTYFFRSIVPPVPMHLSKGAVGPETLPDGRLAMEVKSLHASKIRQIYAVTDIVAPGGEGDRLRHVWRLDGDEVHLSSEDTARVEGPAPGTLRLKSALTAETLPTKLSGDWTVDVETEDGQLVGRISFSVID